MSLWIWATPLALLAVVFAVAPFLRPARKDTGGTVPIQPTDPDRALRALYRQRLEEIKEEYDAGVLDTASRTEVEQELARGLLDEFAPSQADSAVLPGPVDRGRTGARTGGDAQADSAVLSGPVDGGGRTASSTRRGRAWLLVAIGIPLLALAAYLRVGEPQAPWLQDAHLVLALDPRRDRPDIDRWRVRLANRLERRPADAQSRYLLGRLQFGDGDYARAAESFALAHAAAGDDPVIDSAWLRALYLANGGWLDETGGRIAERLLARQSNDPMVLEILAIDAYRRGDYREAVGRFNQALGNASAPTQRAALEHFFEQARSMLGDLEPNIEVELTALAPPPVSATLFVIARPVGGGMPYAVVRRAAVPLPARVRLDDAVTMNPDLPLSAAQRIEVVVRISPTGAAMRQPGDWEWVSDPLLVGDRSTISIGAQLRPPGNEEQSE